MAITIKKIHSDATKPLRHLVLWPHIEKEQDCIISEDQNDDAFHLGAFYNDALIAVGSFFVMRSPKIHHNNQVRLRAMASHPGYRGIGAARMLVLHSLQVLKQKDADVLWCDARLNAVGFYEGIGFQSFHEIYDVPKIGPHRFMYYEL